MVAAGWRSRTARANGVARLRRALNLRVRDRSRGAPQPCVAPHVGASGPGRKLGTTQGRLDRRLRADLVSSPVACRRSAASTHSIWSRAAAPV